MTQFGIWRFASPFYDVEGAGAAVTEPVEAADDGEGSLDEHEAAFGRGGAGPRRPAPTAEPDAEPAHAAAETRERNPDGTFVKPRHRAKSQEATPEDVPRIRELTRKHREAEERAAAAERRAEEAERRARPAAEPAPKPAAPPQADRFPKFDDWAKDAANADKDFEDWIDARSEWNYGRLRADERQKEAAATAAKEHEAIIKAYADKLPATIKRYPDFEDVIAAAPRVSAVIERAVHEVGPDAAYYLATHPDEAAALTEDTLVDRNNPAFKAAVASTRRYLATLVASEQRPSSPSRIAAGSTGAARASVAPPAPKPPTLVRTGATRDADDPPGDESSLAEHEKAFGPKRRRA